MSACQCGCGQKAGVYSRTTPALGKVKGAPRRFLPGHKPVQPATDRLMQKVRIDDETGCWVWTATKTRNGYGLFTSENVKTTAHRWAYTLLVGPVPDGLVLDHLCRNRACVNPEHLEPVTDEENQSRGLRPPLPVARREEAVARFHAGESAASIGREFGCAGQTIMRWVRIYGFAGSATEHAA